MKKIPLLLLIIVSACNNHKSIQVDDEFLTKANEHKEEWLTHGLNYAEDRFSLLNQITKL